MTTAHPPQASNYKPLSRPSCRWKRACSLNELLCGLRLSCRRSASSDRVRDAANARRCIS
jgi:hypothetical protein